jgi:hypothetical protein
MDAKLSEHRHTLLRRQARSGSIDVYAKRNSVGEAKLLCYQENILVAVTEIGAELELQTFFLLLF